MDKLEALDTQVFYWINGTHNALSDVIFWTLSQAWFFAVVLVAAFFFIVLPREKKACWMVILGIGLCILLADRLSVLCFKEIFFRLRPCHVLENVRLFDGHCGGKYGFVSSHAANSFALATFLALIYKKVKFFPFLILFWAVLVSYSRPYLGVHYPGDVICGAILGIGIGSVVYWLYMNMKQYSKIKLRNPDLK